MSKAKLDKRTCRVALSGYHGGQICTPLVTVTAIGSTYYAEWHWDDASVARGRPGREYGGGKASGDFWAVVGALKADGVRIDDITG